MIKRKWPENSAKGVTDSPAKTDKTSVKLISSRSFVSNVSFVSEGLRYKILLKPTPIGNKSIIYSRTLDLGLEVLNARNT